MNDLFNMAGMDLPAYLGKDKKHEDDGGEKDQRTSE
jgi:hypothetical protein